MRKLSYEEVKEYIESFGYKLLSKEYIKSSEKLLIKCPIGHEYFVSFNKFQQGRRCPHCANNIKYTYDFVKKYIENFGYELLSEEYQNTHEKLKIKCDKGHIYKTSFSSLKNQNSKCPYCRGNVKYTYEEVKEYIELFGYELLSNEYLGAKEHLKLKCPKGHMINTMTFERFKRGNRCSKCQKCSKHIFEEVKEYIESFGYKLLSNEYVNSCTNLLVVCPNNHKYEVRFGNFQQGQRCPICNISKGEQRIMNWLNENEIQYVYDKPYFKDLLSPLGNPLRPDFIIEDKKVWIEYDGEFHYENKIDENCYETLIIHDKIKNKYAKENNWRLIRIPYWEFDNIENILKSELEL